MIKEGLQYLVGLGAPNLVSEGVLQYTDKQLHLIMPPMDVEIQVGTLTGFADAIAALAVTKVLLRIGSPSLVECADVDVDEWGRRQIHVTAKHDHSQFKFGAFMSPEEMVIGLRSKFVAGQQDDLAYVCQMVGNISNEV